MQLRRNRAVQSMQIVREVLRHARQRISLVQRMAGLVRVELGRNTGEVRMKYVKYIVLAVGCTIYMIVSYRMGINAFESYGLWFTAFITGGIYALLGIEFD